MIIIERLKLPSFFGSGGIGCIENMPADKGGANEKAQVEKPESSQKQPEESHLSDPDPDYLVFFAVVYLYRKKIKTTAHSSGHRQDETDGDPIS